MPTYFKFIFLIFLLSGCAVGPDYQRSSNVIEWFDDVEDTHRMGYWWQSMDDATTNELVTALLAQNLDLQSALARIEQARAQYQISTGEAWPTLSANLNRTRIKQEGNNAFIASGAPGTLGGLNNTGAGVPIGGQISGGNLAVGGFPMQAGYYQTFYSGGLSTSWQLDLFGGIRRSIYSARASLLASQADYDALVHTLVSQLVRQRIATATLEAQLDLLQDIVTTRERTFTVVERRYLAGANASALDVLAARESLTSIQVQIPDVQANLYQARGQLAVLLGQREQSVSRYALLPPPTELIVAPGIALLDRRPDLRRNELRLVAATNDVGVAIAALYPDVSLSLDLTKQAARFSDLFGNNNVGGSFSVRLLQAIFQGGRLRANVRFSKARVKELQAGYELAVLNAALEVDTALFRERTLRQQYQQQLENTETARRAEDLALRRYRLGLADLLQLLDRQRQRALAEQNLINLQQAMWNNRIDLYLALGGDWFQADLGESTETTVNDND